MVATAWCSTSSTCRLATTDAAVLTAEDVRIVTDLGDMAKVIAEGDPKLKAKVYADLGIRLVYGLPSASSPWKRHPSARVPKDVSEGGLEPPRLERH